MDKCCHITAGLNTLHLSAMYNTIRLHVTACRPSSADNTTAAILSVGVLGKAILGVQNDVTTDNKTTIAILSHGVVGRAILGKE
jgi:hypothetical protein